MVEVVKRKLRGNQAGAVICGALLLALVVVSCSSAPAPKTTIAESPAAPSAESRSEPVTKITALNLREGAPGVLVDVTADGPLMWTSYRDADGGLVVELPNSEPSPSLQGISPESGMVASIVG